MNKNAIQKFAVWARTEMIDQVKQRAYQYGITEESYGEEDAVTANGRALSTDEQRQRATLVQQIKAKDYKQVMEEVAYTWFNRFIALRFMEVNNYLPSHIRIFSDANGAFKPEILGDVLHLELEGLDQTKVAAYIEQNQTDDLYRYLLLTQCNALNSALPGMFERLGSYTELLLPNNILKPDGVLGRLVTDIPEEDWHDQVQIIGWLYQYYNEELKEETYALLKKNVKVTKERIPSATQLFTPDWIVRYMVENSLGRLAMRGRCTGNSEEERIEQEKAFAEKMGWKYYLTEAAQEPDVRVQLDAFTTTHQPQAIKLIDPCMGSGHILVYAFDVLMQIYEAGGISQRDAAQQILQHNLYGLDIDDRAAQLAYFAVMMKARQYDRRIFTRGIQPHLYALKNSQPLHEGAWGYFGDAEPIARQLWEAFQDAKEVGSLLPLNLTLQDLAALRNRLEEMDGNSTMGSLSTQAYIGQIMDTIYPLIVQAEILLQKYDVVITNPPYMGSSNMSKHLSNFVKKHYPDSKSDLFACFMEKADELVEERGYTSLITMESWMFLSSYEKLRKKVNQSKTIINMVHMPYLGKGGTSLGINFGTAAVIMKKAVIPDYSAQYEYTVYYECDKEGVPFEFPTKNERWKTAKQSNFSKIPGSPVAYWVSDAMLRCFENGEPLSHFVLPRTGMMTGDNNRFLRLWWEPENNKVNVNAVDTDDAVSSNAKWFPYNKGGDFRRWYGNNDYVVNWQNGGVEIFDGAKKDKRNVQDYPNEYKFKPSITWSLVTSALPSFRTKINSLFDIIGPSLFLDEDLSYQILGFLNSIVAINMITIMNPTLGLQGGNIKNLPVKKEMLNKYEISNFVKRNIEFSNKDWDSFETSWDFKHHPLV